MYVNEYYNSFKKGVEDTETTISGEKSSIEEFFEEINSCITKNTRIFFYGNGASMAFASHMSLDWHKNGKVQSHTLSDISLLTAYMNDYSKEEMFKQHLISFAPKETDIVCTISSSGNSSNIIGVLDYCNKLGLRTISFSGLKRNNKSMVKSYYSLYVPLKTYGQVECAHQLYLHLWLDMYMGIKEWDRNEVQNMNSDQFRI